MSAGLACDGQPHLRRGRATGWKAREGGREGGREQRWAKAPRLGCRAKTAFCFVLERERVAGRADEARGFTAGVASPVHNPVVLVLIPQSLSPCLD